MSFINIICEDKIGLTIDNIFHKIIIPISKKNYYNEDNIKIICINKLNEIYNPKYPYFFSNLKNSLKFIKSKMVVNNDNLQVELYSSKNLYKIKLTSVASKPIYSLLFSDENIRSILEEIMQKYDYILFGKFEYFGNIIQINKPISLYNLDVKYVNEIKYSNTNKSIFDYSST
jgi:hypothetical protein